ncbi:MAG: hypothetical protein ACYS8X_01430, partial [Planctomycetota bacterium]
PKDRLEVEVDGFYVDLVRGDQLVEFQTAGFSAIRRKLETLAADHRVRLVHPIAAAKWIVRLNTRGTRIVSRRRSPKHGSVDNIFEELVSLPGLLVEPNFSLEVLITHEEDVRKNRRKRSWRGKDWSACERRLLDVIDRWVFETPDDLADLLPPDLPDAFTTADIATGLAKPRWLAQKMAYCLRECGAIAIDGKRGNAAVYRRVTPTA